ncbi:MAG: hypothetical protein Q7T36_00925 [Fluviicoccus sp.]|uniref:spermine/spermidine synthase domain-containing protein n=1 Tax=Fluviicoccus sp. TaxID=2003552 RepID=UPI00271A10AE|nr:hypothetical protein [Fluviicoccus sp.]MDO8329016.1 hypothetical protein [Fluviicoccus sp.]
MRPTFQNPVLLDDGETLSLHFNNIHVQSEMRVDAPVELVFGYTQAMMAFLLVQPQPQDILLVGLGGGSLSKYCHFFLPESCITTVEINPEVIALRDSFHIPPDSPRFRIVQEDGVNYMRHQRDTADVILLDGYDDTGLPDALTTPLFYRDCYLALRDGGILVSNYNCDDLQLATCLGRLGKIFSGKVLIIKSQTSGNKVLFAFKNYRHLPHELMMERAERLKHRSGLPMPHFGNQLIAGSRAWSI